MRRSGPASIVLGVAVLAASCGGGSTPTAATPTAATPPPAPPPWTLTGHVVATNQGAPVAHAHVDPFFTQAVDTDASGAFTLTAPTGPGHSQAITVTADGYLTRETVIQLPRTSDPVVDVISTAAPFDQQFYNQLARDGYEHPDKNYALCRWDKQLTFYLRTTDENGRVITNEILDVIRQGLREGVQYFSNNTYQAIIEEGTEVRPERSGYVNVEALQKIPDDDNACGLATSVGANPMTIKLRIDYCGCGRIKVPITVVIHEVGHSLGMFHVQGDQYIMNPTETFGCADVIPTDKERYHAALMYSRPRGNQSPDRDPGGFALLNGLTGERPPGRR
jgi:hypothetical protein